jgi:hypothetical protein
MARAVQPEEDVMPFNLSPFDAFCCGFALLFVLSVAAIARGK